MRGHFVDEVMDLELVCVLPVGGGGGIRVQRLFVVWDCGVDEFGACEYEEFFVALFTRFDF